ncbi:hypothetical protein GYMLUDRAFT_224106 [Collybiopsis luxurians FD-317 M1]|uniref:DUF7918 domain-containing protein n=1 Tax=Collybiopsis luxurians FD-317 M1 TaxID=944289 RepID=A0A0D0BDP3_9AGAR|nr:hypothetical protein GYMLUDRAFT_224106 [Collybiopsis luxurians FD-317 M1]
MLRIGPYSAWIVVDGARLETHNPVLSRKNNFTTASGWIPSEAGKKFSLHWHNAVRDVALEAVVSIDGVECNRHVMLPASEFPDKSDTFRISYTRTSESTRRDFVFSVIQVTDDEEHSTFATDISKFGVINLDLWRIHIKRVVRCPLPRECKYPALKPQVVHERSKMDGMHHVKSGEEYKVPLSTVDMVDGEKMDKAPYVSFKFRYKPREFLLAQRIITRSPSPELELRMATGHRIKSRQTQTHGQYSRTRSHRGSIQAQMSISRLILWEPLR